MPGICATLVYNVLKIKINYFALKNLSAFIAAVDKIVTFSSNIAEFLITHRKKF
jgi:anionic cell wall polymer biosynthesis LytR-Cps2A-Psr (LCP) family protein